MRWQSTPLATRFGARTRRRCVSATPADAPVARENARDLGLGSNLDAEVARGCRKRLRQSAHSAAHVAPYAALAVGLAHDVVEEHVGGAGHRGRHERADDRVGRDRALEFLRFEPAIENRARRAGEHFDRFAHRRVQAAAARGPSSRLRAVAPNARTQEVRRNLRQRRLDDRGDALEHRFVARIALGVALAELRDLFDVARAAGAQHQITPVEERRKRGRIAFDRFEAVLAQPQIAMISGRKRLLT